MTGVQSHGNKKTNKLPLLDTLGMVTSASLVLQYLLGMYANLFVEIPEDVNRWAFTGTSPGIAAHMLLGILMMVLSIALPIISIKKKNNEWVVFSILGLVGILC